MFVHEGVLAGTYSEVLSKKLEPVTCRLESTTNRRMTHFIGMCGTLLVNPQGNSLFSGPNGFGFTTSKVSKIEYSNYGAYRLITQSGSIYIFYLC